MIYLVSFVFLFLSLTVDAVPPSFFPVTINSTHEKAPSLTAYSAIGKGFRVSYMDGTNKTDLTGSYPWMRFSTNSSYGPYYTSAVSVVSYTSGVVDFYFASSDLNWSNGLFGFYGVGVSDSNGTFGIYRQGLFVVVKSAFGAGVAMPTANSNIDWSGYSHINAPWLAYTNAGYTKFEADARFAMLTDFQDATNWTWGYFGTNVVLRSGAQTMAGPLSISSTSYVLGIVASNLIRSPIYYSGTNYITITNGLMLNGSTAIGTGTLTTNSFSNTIETVWTSTGGRMSLDVIGTNISGVGTLTTNSFYSNVESIWTSTNGKLNLDIIITNALGTVTTNSFANTSEAVWTSTNGTMYIDINTTNIYGTGTLTTNSFTNTTETTWTSSGGKMSLDIVMSNILDTVAILTNINGRLLRTGDTGAYVRMTSYESAPTNIATTFAETDLFTNGTFSGNANGWRLTGGLEYNSSVLQMLSGLSGTVSPSGTITIPRGGYYHVSYTLSQVGTGTATWVGYGATNVYTFVSPASNEFWAISVNESIAPTVTIVSTAGALTFDNLHMMLVTGGDTITRRLYAGERVVSPIGYFSYVTSGAVTVQGNISASNYFSGTNILVFSNGLTLNGNTMLLTNYMSNAVLKTGNHAMQGDLTVTNIYTKRVMAVNDITVSGYGVTIDSSAPDNLPMSIGEDDVVTIGAGSGRVVIPSGLPYTVITNVPATWTNDTISTIQGYGVVTNTTGNSRTYTVSPWASNGVLVIGFSTWGQLEGLITTWGELEQVTNINVIGYAKGYQTIFQNAYSTNVTLAFTNGDWQSVSCTGPVSISWSGDWPNMAPTVSWCRVTLAPGSNVPTWLGGMTFVDGALTTGSVPCDLNISLNPLLSTNRQVYVQ